MKRRKLLSPAAYVLIQSKLSIGVPLTRIIKDLDLQISRPALSRLLMISEDSFTSHVDDSIAMQNSLLPKWVDTAGPYVQEQPDEWKYEGLFPLGAWINENN